MGSKAPIPPAPFPSGRGRRIWIAATVLLVLLLAAPVARGNGGTVRVASQPAGPYALTVFTSPNPIRVGTADVSVLVQRLGGNEVVQDARVRVEAAPAGREGAGGGYEATHELATNKLYYAAHVQLPSQGQWRIDVRVEGPEGRGDVSFTVEASPAELTDNPLLLVAIAAVPLLGLAVWLARTRGRDGDDEDS